MTEDYLFSSGDFRATSEMWKQEIVASITAMDGDELLNTSSTDLAQFYVSEYTFEVPEIQTENIVVSHRETQIDVSKDRYRWVEDRSRPRLVQGISIDVEVPFEGDMIGFRLKPSMTSMNPPRACVGESALTFSVTGTDLTSEIVNQEIERKISSITVQLERLGADANSFNIGLEAFAAQVIEQRKEKLLADKSIVAGLGYKIRERPGAAKTFAAAIKRKPIRQKAPKPAASRKPYVPEPTLTGEVYEHILTVLENMVRVMEHSPGAFREIDEESLRTHFLVQLNGHFIGDATGETFNYEGKTDILIKVDGKNIFVGECKFWTGEKGYLQTLDQVLSYLSWRDTKAAVLIFSRNQDFTGVLQKMEECTPDHPNFKKLLNKRSESSWTYLFSHKDDLNREITITVQAYNVPDRIVARARK